MSSSLKKISIIGCGWLGLPLGRSLVKAGYTVKGSTTTESKLERLEQAGIQPYLIKLEETVAGEVRDFFQTDLLLINIPPGRRREDVARRYPAEIRMLMDRALAEGVKRVIFVSSTGVYANVNEEVTEEETRLAEKGSGGALVSCEQYLQSLLKEELTILRLAGLVGGDRKAGRFLAGKQQVSNGDAPVNMVHRDDCIAVIKKIVDSQILGQVFNVCADEHPTRKDFYTSQALKNGFEPPGFAEGEEDLSYKIVSNQKLKSLLDYRFLHPDPMEF